MIFVGGNTHEPMVSGPLCPRTQPFITTRISVVTIDWTFLDLFAISFPMRIAVIDAVENCGSLLSCRSR
jgi:hypothetical protein